jgi:hypothetical protein
MQDSPRPLPVTSRLLAGDSVTRTDLEAEIGRDLDPAGGITARDVVATMLRAGWVGVVAADGPDGPAMLEMRPLRTRVS